MYEREAAVAGQFYEDSEPELKKQIEDCFLKKEFGPEKLPTINQKGERKIIGLVVPHAGYMYSGPTAANGYFHLASDGKPEDFIIIGPNHTGLGKAVSVMNKGVWKTPLGKVSINKELAEKIIENSSLAEEDSDAHLYEHSIEVQLPFLQYTFSNFEFVPICLLNQDYDACLDLGTSISKIISKNTAIIASSDFTHFETNSIAHKQDQKALDILKEIDAKKFINLVDKENLSVCGYGAITTLLVVAEKVKAESFEVIKYSTSGDVTGNTSSVVGYASIKVMR